MHRSEYGGHPRSCYRDLPVVDSHFYKNKSPIVFMNSKHEADNKIFSGWKGYITGLINGEASVR